MPYALLIDDEQDLIQSVRALVDAQGLELLTAASWNEGFDLFLTLSPDVVIADYNLIGIETGLELLLKVKQLRPGVRVVLLSGYLTDAEVSAVEASAVVERALRKNGAGMAAVAEEIREASQRAAEPTDWVSVATGYQSGAFDDSEIQLLLGQLRRPVGDN